MQDQPEHLPTVLWTIPCFDRKRANPLPVFNRSYVLDWPRLSIEEVNEMFSIIQARDGRQTFSPSGLDETVVTMSFGPQRTDDRMLKYRRFFVEVQNGDLEQVVNGEDPWKGGFHTVNLGREYFEDESGQPITSYEMIQHVSGIECPVIIGDPKSILRLGVSAPSDLNLWSTHKANTIAQFLDVVQRICTSAWYRSPQSLTTLVAKSGSRDLLEALGPNDHAVMSVLPYFRQLHAQDNLLANAIDAYVMHCSDARKVHWMSERRNAFGSLVDSAPILRCVPSQTRDAKSSECSCMELDCCTVHLPTVMTNPLLSS